MNAGQTSSRLSALSPLCALALLSGCAVSTPATLSIAQASEVRTESVRLLGEDDESNLRVRFHSALRNSIKNRSIAVKEDADLIGDFAISARDATIAVQSAAQSTDNADALEPGFKPRFYHKCKPDRIQAALVLYSRKSGEIKGRSEGEFLACPGDFSELDDLAELLVDQALSD